LEQLDVGEHLAIERNVDVVRRLAQVGGDRGFRGGRRRRRVERGNRQQLVNRRRLGLFLDEPVALRQRHQFVRADALDERVEMSPNPRLGAGAVGRLQQQLDREIKGRPGLFQVPQFQFLLAGGEMALGLGNEVGDGVLNGDRLGREDLGYGRWRGDRDLDRLRRTTAPCDQKADADSCCHGQRGP
jgi:hypothetical protein